MNRTLLVLSALAVSAFVGCAVNDEGTDTSSDEVNAGADACRAAEPNLTKLCSADYDPVCGCDGNTYSNACAASRFLTSSTPGACPDGGADAGVCTRPEPQLMTVCSAEYDPVCGCDGNTYSNACAASRFLTSSTPGACP